MTDAWNELQALKSKQSGLKARLAARKKEREGLVAEITKSVSPSTQALTKKEEKPVVSSTSSVVPSPTVTPAASPIKQEPVKIDPDVEKTLLLVLCEVDVPVEASDVKSQTAKMLGRDVRIDIIQNLLSKFAAQGLLSISTKTSGKDDSTVTSVDLTKLSAVTNEQGGTKSTKKRKREDDEEETEQPTAKHSRTQTSQKDASNSIESLLSMQSAKEKESKKMTEEILELLSKPTAKEQILVEKFKSQGGTQLKEFCQYGTREECVKIGQNTAPCNRLHFRKIIHKHTDESLGDCSFLNTCFHMDTCKYVHYEIDYPKKNNTALMMQDPSLAMKKLGESEDQVNMFPPQWIQCDMRYLDMTVLGKCAVIMADPPWDIHMELPYGTMSDDEMRRLPVPTMQDDGFMFLWVTGRAMELGRECLELWGYKRIDEIIWVKTNQLQRIIRTGRTGHWLNHGKEHCLVGVKGNPKGVNRGLDCDVIVAEVRATSHKPDEIYGIIERLSPGTRKVELFGRPHNVQPNWITLGNQLEGVKLLDPDIVGRFREKYPDGNCMEPPKT